MPSNTQQADRRVSELQEQIARASGAATMAASRLADPQNLRRMLDNLSKIFSSGASEPIKMAIAYGRALEALVPFEEDVKTIASVAELRLQRDKLGPLTTAAAEKALEE